MLHTIKQFMRDEQGLETVEYAVMTALIVVGLVAAVTALRGQIIAAFTATGTAITPTP